MPAAQKTTPPPYCNGESYPKSPQSSAKRQSISFADRMNGFDMPRRSLTEGPPPFSIIDFPRSRGNSDCPRCTESVPCQSAGNSKRGVSYGEGRHTRFSIMTNASQRSASLFNVRGLDIVTQLRFQSIISNVRSSSHRSASIQTVNQSLTDEERLMLEQLLEREDRRKSAYNRFVEHEAQGERKLVKNELIKEKAALRRYVALEESKTCAIAQRRKQREARSAMARARRLEMERERRDKLGDLQEQWERRLKVQGARTAPTTPRVRASFKI
uniref:Uncharacterized protein TCIL3000_11_13640 n=1 Tax=Trypanosoma congolense (strain IL3000) TaxID=1068625 RepID=G0V2I6_TRYCI|nr:unnamed protein product [Trypanosoma congolense IL3000]